LVIDFLASALAHSRKPQLQQRYRLEKLLPPAVGLLAAAVLWALDYVFVADGSSAALFALPLWLAIGAALGWLVGSWRTRTREQRLAEARLGAVENATGDAVLRTGADGLITAWSPAAKAIYGYGSGDIVGRPLAELFPGADAGTFLDGRHLKGDVVEQRRRDGSVFSALVTVIPTGDEDEESLEAVVVARDVGEVRRIRDELRNADTRFRSLTEHLPLVTYLQSAGRERETTYVSEQIDRLLGYTRDEWLHDPGLFLRLVHPDDRDAVAAARDAVEEPNGLRTTYRMVGRDGRVVWVREEAVTVLDESGEPLCIQGYLQDVSERRAAAEQRNELRAAHAAAGEEVRDRQAKIDFLAEAASVLSSSAEVSSTVRQAAALAVRELADWCVVDEVHEEGTVTRLAAEREPSTGSSPEPDLDPEPSITDLIRGRRPVVADTYIRLPLMSRGHRPVGALTLIRGEHAPPYGLDDLPWAKALAGMIAVAIDNSRLFVEVEARQDAYQVLSHVGDGVFLLDRNGLIRLWNPTAAAITGIAVDMAQLRSASDTIPGWHELSERIPVGTTKEHVRPLTLPLETDRGERWISIAGVEFPSGTVYGFRDITEEHQLEELKAEFIATASHELRTPLAAVYGAAQTLRRHDFALDAAGRDRFISLIVDESDRLANIVNQILLANQLEVGRVDLEMEPFDAAELVERVVETRKTHAPSNVTLEVEAEPGLPAVAADKDRAQQVLVNLVENAIKYSPDGGRIRVGADPGDGAVVFRVVDEGMGIPAEEQEKIFEKFYRLDPNMTRGIGGTGLGLYICSELVERMGGTIWLESEEGKGSAFYFELPSVGAHPVLPRARELEEQAQAQDVTG
jgi:PAS domain S-box-containing protein